MRATKQLSIDILHLEVLRLRWKRNLTYDFHFHILPIEPAEAARKMDQSTSSYCH
jgi:hypothetical protein